MKPWVRSGGKVCGILLVFLLVFGWLSWPLPLDGARAIPSSHRPEVGGARNMVPGDHLQLLYYFELMSQFITGDTPWFHNLYEFNLGDDDATYFPDGYYIPFSLVYTLGNVLAGPAVGWNLASLFSVGIGCLGCWLLTGLWMKSRSLRVLAMLAAVLLPYRWITLQYGSPTGFAISYVPLIMWGLGAAIRERRLLGGWVAGVCFALSAWGDLHTFFFSGLIIPFWCLFMYLESGGSVKDWRRLLALLKPLSGFILMGLIAVAQAWFIQNRLKGGTMSEGRQVEEVALFSHPPKAFFDLNPQNPDSQMYLPITLLVLLVAATGWGLWQHFRESRAAGLRQLLVSGLMLGVILLILQLSLGTQMVGVDGALAWKRLCRLVPPYTMIRQPVKILVLLGPMALILIAHSLRGLKLSGVKSWSLAGVVGLMMIGETASRLDPTICILEAENTAYGAVESHAVKQGWVPRAVVVVLWPGNSHWTSLYQYRAVRQHVRMVNGYRPKVDMTYFDEVFIPFSPLNQGVATDDMLDSLLEQEIRYVMVHEDAFPEKVSPFGVGQTLDRLLVHPRIKFLEQDRAVWAFEVLADEDPTAVTDPGQTAVSATVNWSLRYHVDPELLPGEPGPIEDDSGAQRGAVVRLVPGEYGLKLIPYETQYRENLRLSLHVKGRGRLGVQFTFADGANYELDVPVDEESWGWVVIPYPAFDGAAQDVSVRLTAMEGEILADAAMQVEGALTEVWPVGQTRFWPAKNLFHAGYADYDDGSVNLEPEWAPYGDVVYGPRLPLPPGTYRVTLRVVTDPDAEGTQGAFRLREPIASETVILQPGDSEAVIEVQLERGLPFVGAFTYHRHGTVRVLGLAVERIK